jgi:hypothetical protein
VDIELVASPQRFRHGAVNRLLGLEILFVIVAAGILCDGLEEIPDGVEWQQAGTIEVNVGGDARMVSAVRIGRDTLAKSAKSSPSGAGLGSSCSGGR